MKSLPRIVLRFSSAREMPFFTVPSSTPNMGDRVYASAFKPGKPVRRIARFLQETISAVPRENRRVIGVKREPALVHDGQRNLHAVVATNIDLFDCKIRSRIARVNGLQSKVVELFGIRIIVIKVRRSHPACELHDGPLLSRTRVGEP